MQTETTLVAEDCKQAEDLLFATVGGRVIEDMNFPLVGAQLL
eukprot:COSAG05_NODE_25825_length_193_cov_40.489362_1_plen_41_part_01